MVDIKLLRYHDRVSVMVPRREAKWRCVLPTVLGSGSGKHIIWEKVMRHTMHKTWPDF